MRRHPLAAFFALTFGLTWGLGACFALFPSQLEALFGKPSLGNPLFILAVYAPGISAMIMSATIGGGAGCRRLLSKFLIRRVGLRWYITILVGIPALSAFATLISIAFSPATIALDHWYELFLRGPSGLDIAHSLTSGSGGLTRMIGGVAAVVLMSILSDPGPLGEELGWRGFALPRLLERHKALPAALIVGVVWGVWHLPAFFIVGLPQSKIPFPLFMVSIVSVSILMTWAFNRTRGSVLIAALIHWIINTCLDLSHAPIAMVTAVLLLVAAVTVVLIAGPALSRSTGQSDIG